MPLDGPLVALLEGVADLCPRLGVALAERQMENCCSVLRLLAETAQHPESNKSTLGGSAIIGLGTGW